MVHPFENTAISCEYVFLISFVLKMDANASSSTYTDCDNSNGDASTSNSISDDNYTTKTKSTKSAVWKFCGFKDEVAVKKEIALCQIFY